MGMINAASDNIPMLVMAGRTPITEHERFGARMTPIQYGQEMRDQTAMVRELAKWDYEMREEKTHRQYTLRACLSPEAGNHIFVNVLSKARPNGVNIHRTAFNETRSLI